ncbi:MAG TPA: iron-sulfur cluster repair di-iron protein [Vicinamibacterales bacterium]|nr:iron-sulfur cluster repair di-iron protein [Vicinamibacterales bacterium]
MNATPETTIREIVANDYRTAAVFQRFGLDFCCNGCRTVEQGCRDAGADENALLRELDAVLNTAAGAAPRFADWNPPALVTYIIANHHGYVRNALPALLQHTRKIAGVHGERHTELAHIARLVERIADEMTDHMAKEEHILFPFIVALAEAAGAGCPAPRPPFGTVENPIRMMEQEHRFVGDAMAEIRSLTDGYRVPEDACTTYRVCLQELEAFETDLHAHVHLENNILFPKAVEIEATGSRRAP